MARKQRSRGQGTLFKRGGGGPWIASWYDHNGKRREASTRTTDKAAAMRQVPRIGQTPPAAAAAAGSYNDKATEALSDYPQLYPQQLGRETVRTGAAQRDERGNGKQSEGSKKANENGAKCTPGRRDATACDDYPQGDSNPCLQDENLGSSNRKYCQQRTYDLMAGSLADFLVLLEKEFPDLAVVMNKWDRMPKAIRQAMLVMCGQ